MNRSNDILRKYSVYLAINIFLSWSWTKKEKKTFFPYIPYVLFERKNYASFERQHQIICEKKVIIPFFKEMKRRIVDGMVIQIVRCYVLFAQPNVCQDNMKTYLTLLNTQGIMTDWCNSDLRSVSPIVIECVEIVQRSAYIFHPNDDKNIDSLGLIFNQWSLTVHLKVYGGNIAKRIPSKEPKRWNAGLSTVWLYRLLDAIFWKKKLRIVWETTPNYLWKESNYSFFNSYKKSLNIPKE
jgi:hypothetical protein